MYYTIQITRANDITAPQIFGFNDEKSAKTNYFYFLSSCYGNENLDYFMGAIIDADGNLLIKDSWYKPNI